MDIYKHSVSLDIEKCKGCTNCLKRCPTEAIRIRDGHAVINPKRCIDCGECIRICPYKAKKASYDKLDALERFKYKIALPAPSLYGQFDNLDDVDIILQGLVDMGFDEVYEVAKAAELVSGYTRQYLKDPNVPKPVISSACPAIVRIIHLRFPFLCKNIMPMLPPIEIAGKLARDEALAKHPELKADEIGVCFISPCPAKVSYVKNERDNGESNIDVVVSIRDVYFELLDLMKRDAAPEVSTEAGMIGLGWASAGGESSAIFNERYLAADGIENVINVLEQIENSDFPELEFIELNACNGGCVGGAMTIANPYIAKARLQSLKRYLPVSPNFVLSGAAVPEEYISAEITAADTGTPLASNRREAMRMMTEIQKLQDLLPALDCGFCGAPSCMAFAEDVVKGEAKLEECIPLMRKSYHGAEEDGGVNEP